MPMVFFTSGSSWPPPADCFVLDWVDCIGGGATGMAGAPGGGGAWARKYNVPVAGMACTYSVGTAGVDTSFSVNGVVVCLAKGGTRPTGGQASSCIGDQAYSGGTCYSSRGAGGAAGPYGNGMDGGSKYHGGAGDAGYGGAGGSGAAQPGQPGAEYDASHGSGGGGAGGNGSNGGLYGGGGGAGTGNPPGAQGLIVAFYTPGKGGPAGFNMPMMGL